MEAMSFDTCVIMLTGSQNFCTDIFFLNLYIYPELATVDLSQQAGLKRDTE